MADESATDALLAAGMRHYMNAELDEAFAKWQQALQLDPGCEAARKRIEHLKERHPRFRDAAAAESAPPPPSAGMPPLAPSAASMPPPLAPPPAALVPEAPPPPLEVKVTARPPMAPPPPPTPRPPDPEEVSALVELKLDDGADHVDDLDSDEFDPQLLKTATGIPAPSAEELEAAADLELAAAELFSTAAELPPLGRPPAPRPAPARTLDGIPAVAEGLVDQAHPLPGIGPDTVLELKVAMDRVPWDEIGARGAFLLSRVDGATTFDQLLLATGIGEEQVRAALERLLELRVVGPRK